MDRLLGCSVTTELYAAWSRLLVTDPEPLILTEEARALLPPGTLVLTEREFYENYAIAPLALRDSYNLYQVTTGLAGVALLSAVELHSLAPDIRTAILRIQWAVKRGQIYDDQFVHGVLADFPAQLDRFLPQLFTTPDGPKLALTRELWQGLPAEAQRRWLTAYIAADEADCRHNLLSEAEWSEITEQHGPSIRALAGTFADQSGPNCFACALAAVTPSPDHALMIAGLWLHQAPFLRGLAERGLTPRPLPDAPDPAAVPPGVLVWSNAAGLPQHACYALGGGLALNKQAQRWSAPRQLVRLRHLLDSWHEDHLTLSLYVR